MRAPDCGAGVNGGTKGTVIGAALVVGLAGGWFLMSHLIMQTSVSDALGESLGVGLGLLMVASVVGAVVASRNQPDQTREEQSHSEDAEPER